MSQFLIINQQIKQDRCMEATSVLNYNKIKQSMRYLYRKYGNAPSQNLLTNLKQCHKLDNSMQNMNEQIHHNNTLVDNTIIYDSSQDYQNIQQILEEGVTATYIRYKDECIYSQQEQYMKRFYGYSQYGKKIRTLSEYYRFHRNLPQWNQYAVSVMMEKCYDKLKDFDYKKIKNILKVQQGISLTTRQTFSSFQQQSGVSIQSNYSNLLDQLQKSESEVFLKDVCQKIGYAFKKMNVQTNFKGCYYSGQRKFQQYLKKQKNKKQHKKIIINSEKNKPRQIFQTSNSQTKKIINKNQIKNTKEFVLSDKRLNTISNNKQSSKKQEQSVKLSSDKNFKNNNLQFYQPKNVQNAKYYAQRQIYKQKSKQGITCQKNTNNVKKILIKNNKKQYKNSATYQNASQKNISCSTKYKMSKQITKLQNASIVKNSKIAQFKIEDNFKKRMNNNYSCQKLIDNRQKSTKKTTIHAQKTRQIKQNEQITQRSRSRSTTNLNPQYSNNLIRDHSKKSLISSLKNIKGSIYPGVKGSVIELSSTTKFNSSSQKSRLSFNNSNRLIRTNSSQTKIFSSTSSGKSLQKHNKQNKLKFKIEGKEKQNNLQLIRHFRTHTQNGALMENTRAFNIESTTILSKIGTNKKNSKDKHGLQQNKFSVFKKKQHAY